VSLSFIGGVFKESSRLRGLLLVEAPGGSRMRDYGPFMNKE